VNSLWAGAAVAATRLRRPSAWLAPALALGFVMVAALLERRVSAARAADHALTGATFGLALPLLAYFTVTCTTGRSRLDAALGELGRHGVHRRLGAAGLAGTTAALLAPMGALLACTTVLFARGLGDPRLLSDLGMSAWLGVLAAFCYAAWFAFGSLFGAAGGGRTVVLLVDWVLGSGSTALAIPCPRGHLRNLLGAEPVMQMPQWSALLAVGLLTCAYMGLVAWRTQR
jgi:hypothetical protein